MFSFSIFASFPPKGNMLCSNCALKANSKVTCGCAARKIIK